MREPIWDGDSIVFAVEDAGNIHLYRVAAGRRRAGARLRRRDRPLGLRRARRPVVVRTGSTAPNLSELYAGDRQLTDVGSEFAEGRELVAPERFTAVSKDGTEVDAWIVRPAGFEEGKRYPGPPEHPRRPVHPVRERLLRRDPGLRRRRLRGRLLEPARLVRLLGGVGPRDPRARASSGRAGARSTTRT